MKKVVLPLYLMAFSFSISAQEAETEEAWLYLSDKANVTTYLANPISMLTQKAIDRKNRHNVVIDERDVPINEKYISALKNATGITVMAKSKWSNAVHVRGKKCDIDALLNSQESLLTPQKEFIDKVVFADRSKNITFKGENKKQTSKFETVVTTYDYGNAANQIEMFNGDKLHQEGYTGSGVTIAIMDGGFPNVNTMKGFEKLRNDGHIIDDYDFVNRDNDVYTNTFTDHGTHVLSAMAGYFNDDVAKKYYVGTAPDASYYLYITEDSNDENPVEESYWVEAVERADSLGVDIINTSLGYDDFDPGSKYDYNESAMDGKTAFITQGANIAFEKGLLLVTAAGNAWGASIGAPADAPNTLTIGAVDYKGDYAMFSSAGTGYQSTIKPDVVAQGANVYVIKDNDAIGTTSGTSFSSPILAGGVACLWQVFPDLTNLELMDYIRESSSQYETPDFMMGHGIPDFEMVFNKIYPLATDNVSNISEIQVYPNPIENQFQVQLPAQIDGATLSLFNILGKRISTYVISNKSNPIDTTTLIKGVYILKVETPKEINTFRLIKQ
ncbi:S8 family peptidase [Algibacter miyuki]|uniref:S8 family peptidase n=2 Tax=Algibacter miyuki TaxID=1306933 RepID=A0ABV5H009_9FLAO|nr:S8 family peptidase [Algibacter miyuki]MDN3667495.1 S8 family peptidase [Algibacter miyuki]